MSDMAKSGKLKVPVTTLQGHETRDGAGVRLRRIFGGTNTYVDTDPFLLLDNFGSNKVEEYISGFPWHPHRGIETVTYLLEGKVEHEDSEGNRGTIYPNDLQWMTAGSGIFHQEMPKPIDTKDPKEMLKSLGMNTSVVGFQLWVNIPAAEKMRSPTYRGIKGSTTPVVDTPEGGKVKVISGKYDKVVGAFEGGGTVGPTYLDVKIPENTTFTFSTHDGYTAMAYLLSGSVTVKSAGNDLPLEQGQATIFSRGGDIIDLTAGESGSRFIILSGKPLNEHIEWYGPIVMNTYDQVQEAMRDLRSNKFVRDKNPQFL